MRKRNKNFIDKIEVKHGVKYIVRYMNGKEIGKIPYDDFKKYFKIQQKGSKSPVTLKTGGKTYVSQKQA